MSSTMIGAGMQGRATGTQAELTTAVADPLQGGNQHANLTRSQNAPQIGNRNSGGAADGGATS